MDGTRFDALARAGRAPTTRRPTIGLLLGSALGALDLTSSDVKEKKANTQASGPRDLLNRPAVVAVDRDGSLYVVDDTGDVEDAERELPYRLGSGRRRLFRYPFRH